MQRSWDAPLAGVFTYGEYGSDSANGHDFHNEAFVLVRIAER